VTHIYSPHHGAPIAPRILIRLLNESADPIVLAVAVHDIGQYVKHYERGKKSVPRRLSSERYPPTLTFVDPPGSSLIWAPRRA
jgi:hypothetical protein